MSSKIRPGSNVGYAEGDDDGDVVGESVEDVGAGDTVFSTFFALTLLLLSLGTGGGLTFKAVVILASCGVSGSIQSARTQQVHINSSNNSIPCNKTDENAARGRVFRKISFRVRFARQGRSRFTKVDALGRTIDSLL